MSIILLLIKSKWQRAKALCAALWSILISSLEFWGLTRRPGLAELLSLHWKIQPTAIIFYDAKTMKVLFANRHFCKKTGYTLQELRSVSYKEMIFPRALNYIETVKTVWEYQSEAEKEAGWIAVKRFTNHWTHGLSGKPIEMNWFTVAYNGILLNELRIIEIDINE